MRLRVHVDQRSEISIRFLVERVDHYTTSVLYMVTGASFFFLGGRLGMGWVNRWVMSYHTSRAGQSRALGAFEFFSSYLNITRCVGHFM